MSQGERATAANKPERFAILDALRFFLAMWVVVAHAGAFPIMGSTPSPGLAHWIARATNSIIWGIPAVMAFFVISGFCIHYPLATGRTFKPGRFYLRRYTRILIPAIAIVLIYFATEDNIKLFGPQSILFRSTLWSLLCEEAYYAAYPLLRILKERFGWKPVLASSMVVSVLISAYYHHARDFFEVGPIGTIIILLPVWLLGCVLADQMAAGERVNVTRAGIFKWRGAAFASMWIAETLNFHGGISQVHTLLLVGCVMFFWLRAELCYARGKTINPWAIKAGAFSYSLYLVHPVLYDFVDAHYPSLKSTYVVGWLFQVGTAVVLSYVFYVFIEGPAHHLAKNLSRAGSRFASFARLG